ncbi:hypothetical protein EDM80_11055 [bacterium]|nr:MAG: hypothetical protein EDM80_11055 [bacterium]
MANKSLFKSLQGLLMPRADTRKDAGGRACKREPRHAPAQYAATGCLHGTSYADAETQLDEVLEICVKAEPEFVAKTAIFAQARGFMKDMPALLPATLAKRDVTLLADVQPSGTTQAAERKDVLNIGGLGGSVFELPELYAKNELSPEQWVGEIEKVKV